MAERVENKKRIDSGRVKERIDNAPSTSCNFSAVGANPADEALQPFADSGQAVLRGKASFGGCPH